MSSPVSFRFGRMKSRFFNLYVDTEDSSSSSDSTPSSSQGSSPDEASSSKFQSFCLSTTPSFEPWNSQFGPLDDLEQPYRNLTDLLDSKSVVVPNKPNHGSIEDAVFGPSPSFDLMKSPSSTLARNNFGFISSPGLTPHDFLIYPQSPLQFAQQQAAYFVETPRQKLYDDMGVDMSAFMIRVEWPDRYIHQMPLTRDPDMPRRHTCKFLPMMPGKYTLSVALTHNPIASGPGLSTRPHRRQQVEIGSSTDVFVSRNYPMTGQLGQNNALCPRFLTKPWGIDVHQQTNRIYVTDRETHQITVLDSDGKVVNVIRGHGENELFRPTGVAVSRDCLYVADKDHHRVSVFNLDGTVSYNPIGGPSRPGNKNGEFNYPWGLAVSPQGNLLAVCDSRHYRVQLFDTMTGAFLRKYSVFEERPFDYKKEFNYPRGIVFDNSGQNLFVTDFNLNAVFKLDVGFQKKSTFVRGNLNRPQGLTVDEAGNVLICDSKKNCIRVVNSAGQYICSIDGIRRGRNSELSEPQDVAVLNGGQVVVVDATGHLYKF